MDLKLINLFCFEMRLHFILRMSKNPRHKVPVIVQSSGKTPLKFPHSASNYSQPVRMSGDSLIIEIIQSQLSADRAAQYISAVRPT
jgi:hypothetical protein